MNQAFDMFYRQPSNYRQTTVTTALPSHRHAPIYKGRKVTVDGCDGAKIPANDREQP